MELHYRGAAYEASADAIETADNGLIGQYRGAALRFRRPKRIAEQPHRNGMKYRGVVID